MEYTLENLYAFVGRDDKVVVVEFIENSESYNEYGASVTMAFIYSPSERANLEANFQSETFGQNQGKIKARYLNSRQKLAKDKIESLKKVGFNSFDIKRFYPGMSHQNLFHEKKTRTITILDIPFNREDKGGDFDWMYRMKKRFIQDGIGLCPYEREWYLAMKKFYEEGKLTDEEVSEMQEDGVLKPSIEHKYLEIKLEKEIISIDEEKKFKELFQNHVNENIKIIEFEVDSAGYSLERFKNERPAFYNFLIKGAIHFNTKRINVMGKKAMYIDFKGFLHVFLRHVKEFEISPQYKGKAKFLWKPDDVITVIQNVICSVETEIQEFWQRNPDTRFSIYGDHSLYFEGDYYTFHIESDGRLSTFHKLEK